MDHFAQLQSDIQLLGRLLGDTIRDAHGRELFDKVEHIRRLSKSARGSDDQERRELSTALTSLTAEELVPVARAFSHFLSLANTAEQLQQVRISEEQPEQGIEALFDSLRASQLDAEAIDEATAALKIELVLTAHPTETTRRSIIHKHRRVSDCLEQLHTGMPSDDAREALMRRLRRLIGEIWHTPEIRSQRPSPVDEAKWGFAVIENSLWQAVPDFLRELDRVQRKTLGRALPITASPVRFVSWMGGDRDGNPNVTATLTHEVLLLARWKAADLYLRDVQSLRDSLSMTACNEEVRALAQGAGEPYRAILSALQQRLRDTLFNLKAELEGSAERRDVGIEHVDELWLPLITCYRSLHEVGIGMVADGPLLDLLRRVRCFGIHLVRLDIRQESARHQQVFSELCQQLKLGDYSAWSEAKKQRFLLAELDNPRPLIPHHWTPSAPVQEVLDTCRVIARQPRSALGAYVISMARQASDVLAVVLLLRECGGHFEMPVAPLFETLDDLENAGSIMRCLFQEAGYMRRINGRQMVMIGYSDSAKDAGVLAASWAQYKAQETLLAIADEYTVDLTLFQGRGGTIGRGGAPARAALLSQPPGSLRSGLRVTEQGEMIRFKLGLPKLAVSTLRHYTSAILEARLVAPPAASDDWRAIMEHLSAISAERYRQLVQHTPAFIDYFREATPEAELGALPLGSRPTRRSPVAGIESLRAIPWQFAWMQNRLLLPAWLGAGFALRTAGNDAPHHTVLEAMCEQWPFFSVRLAMLAMVYAKTDSYLAECYDRKLVSTPLWPLGATLRQELKEDIGTVLNITNEGDLMQDLPWSKQTVELRNIYTDPLNILQTELLARHRHASSPQIEQALMITIGGIAAGMRNAG